MYSLIIFDCDGVLVDSERLSARVFSDVLSRYGVQMGADECFNTFKGLTLSACYRVVESEHNLVLPSCFHPALSEATLLSFNDYLCAVDGVVDVVNTLQEKGVTFCVASNGGHDKIRHALSLTGLLSYFDGAIFSAQDVDKGKPAPDLFLYAASQLGMRPDQCCVVEDSTPGLMASKRAGIDAVYFDPQTSSDKADAQHKEKRLSAYSVSSMSALLLLLTKLTANAR